MSKMEIEDLTLCGIIAFDGLTRNGLHLHQDQEHILYPMGNKITIKNIDSGNQYFLSGHTNLITTLCISPCGKFVASGQINHLGFKTTVIIWDYYKRNIKGKHELHKVRVEDICFSCESNYLITLGGRDDGNLIIWDIQAGSPICGTFASSDISGNTNVIIRINLRDQCFISAGDNILKVWRINPQTHKLYGTDVKVGKLKRCITCIVVHDKDQYAYCGTTSGDIIKIRLNYDSSNIENMEPIQQPIMIDCYSKISKSVEKRKTGVGDLYGGGVNSLLLVGDDELIVGAGDGTIELARVLREAPRVNITTSQKTPKLPNKPQIKTVMSENVNSSVSSIVMLKNEYILVGTTLCEIYRVKLSNFDMRLLITCHTDTIYDIAFPSNYSEIFATCSKNDVRLWRTETQKELLRITIPNFVCSTLCFSYDGTMIVTGWNDGIIRAFTPETGQMIFAIHKAHLNAVSAVAITKKGKKIISGGCDAQVRIWDIKLDVQRLLAVLKEHKGPITHLHISNDDEYVVSSSTDGTCIVWDIEKQLRKQVLMANTMFMYAQFSPNNVQILTCGSDRKISYWETLDGSLIRELEGSGSGAINCIDITPDCKHFITGSNDYVVKCWDYHRGEVTHIALGHAAIVTACKFSPDGKCIITVSADGAIIIWKCPFDFQSTTPLEGSSSRSIKSQKSQFSISNRSGKKIQCKVEQLEVNTENITNLMPDPHDVHTNSVRSIHEGDQSSLPCNCDPSQPSQDICSIKDELKTSQQSTNRSGKSVSSRKSTDSKKSNCSNAYLKNKNSIK